MSEGRRRFHRVVNLPSCGESVLSLVEVWRVRVGVYDQPSEHLEKL